MKKLSISVVVLFVLAVLTGPSVAESGTMTVVGQSQDANGTTATVATVQLGRDRYLAIGLEHADGEQGATQIILKNEVPKLLKMCDEGARTRIKTKKNSFKILDSFPGEGQSLAVVRANLEGQLPITILQINEDGRERNFVLNPQTWKKLRANIKKAQSKL